MTTKKKQKTSEEKFTLVELVRDSNLHYPLVVMNLSRAGLLQQYEEEVEAEGKFDIEPTMTLTEFNKIMEA
ncbi:MAG: hypothetical protein IKF11_02405 [Methanobrevibacter sp.]|nr:hypothetical protein [Methanobrevibacter sp.]